jgi:hypothetical protein
MLLMLHLIDPSLITLIELESTLLLTCRLVCADSALCSKIVQFVRTYGSFFICCVSLFVIRFIIRLIRFLLATIIKLE